MRVIESRDSYEWVEYGTNREGESEVRTIIAGYVADSAVWLKVVFDGFPDSGAFHTAHQLNRRQVERVRRRRERRR